MRAWCRVGLAAWQVCCRAVLHACRVWQNACGLAGLRRWVRCPALLKHASMVGKQAQLLAYLQGCCVAWQA